MRFIGTLNRMLCKQSLISPKCLRIRFQPSELLRRGVKIFTDTINDSDLEGWCFRGEKNAVTLNRFPQRLIFHAANRKAVMKGKLLVIVGGYVLIIQAAFSQMTPSELLH